MLFTDMSSEDTSDLISGYGGSFQELKQMRHFLGKLQCLQTVKVGVAASDNNKFLRAKLLALPRLSSNAAKATAVASGLICGVKIQETGFEQKLSLR
ncbi:unnamed protein product [Microthlaspi erraticum]|uniref:FBD domain-containing protein n=1 Tax=Microthlaspi erraticum TaxID=1685480 RepID=A0A6D2HZ63_9BRAS|nr:unnamed protein product [Microthlaspi erraticum]